jgi:hypothetical protein
MMRIIWIYAMFEVLPKRGPRCASSKFPLKLNRRRRFSISLSMPLEQNLRGRLSLRDVYCWHLCTHFACLTLAFNPQIYGTGVYNAAVLAVSSACSHMFHSTSPCLGKSSAPWRQIFIAARHRLRQILHFLRPDPDLSTPKARAVTTEVIKCTWKVFFYVLGNRLASIYCSIHLFRGFYRAERMVASYSLSYSVDERVHSYSKDSYAKKVFS